MSCGHQQQHHSVVHTVVQTPSLFVRLKLKCNVLIKDVVRFCIISFLHNLRERIPPHSPSTCRTTPLTYKVSVLSSTSTQILEISSFNDLVCSSPYLAIQNNAWERKGVAWVMSCTIFAPSRHFLLFLQA